MAIRYMAGVGVGHPGSSQSSTGAGTTEPMIIDEVEPEINTALKDTEEFYGSDMGSGNSSDATLDSACEEDEDL
ncbi:hypothetical protein FRC08_006296 [Ceratobasidium sp. 394]|nr:hypothetical protein FRC08_006296 [Ceratobasidium sp. 394]